MQFLIEFKQEKMFALMQMADIQHFLLNNMLKYVEKISKCDRINRIFASLLCV